MIKRTLYLFIAAILCTSCREISKSITDTLQTNQEEKKETNMPKSNTANEFYSEDELAELGRSEQPRIFTADKEALQQAENSLRQRSEFQGKPIVIFRNAHFYNDGRIILTIQNPENPEFIDSYHYKNGQWGEPEPVRTTKADRVEERLISLDKVPFVNANKVYESIQQELKEIDFEKPDITVYFVINKNKTRWYPGSIDTERSRYSLEFNEDGTLINFKKD